MTNELRTNDEPQRILLEASRRIQACYPNGTKVEAELDYGRMCGETRYCGLGRFVLVVETPHGIRENIFSPAVHPHRVLP